MSDAGLWAQAACIWEVMACKPGNVHRRRDFPGLTCTDFLLSAAAIAPVMTMACQQHVGLTVLRSIEATRRVVRTNTNLGIVLLLAPLASVPPGEPLRLGVERVLAGLDVEDGRLVYRAIRLAVPGGMGEVAEQDVRAEPTQTLRQVMALAADRDLVARQYANGYAEVLDFGLPALRAGLGRLPLEQAIVSLHLQLMANYPDTLIARKRGTAEAEEAARRAAAVLAAGWPGGAGAEEALADLDVWLCAEGNGRNPGATADLVTACLFAALREGGLSLPLGASGNSIGGQAC
jgi:triphosphoribosyl-dephospho-CoA synthase